MGMQEPHVIALHYRLKTGPQLTFRNPPPLEHATPGFRLLLADDLLRVGPKGHFANEQEARLTVEPYLRSWEIATGLRDGPGAIRFVYEGAEVIDHEPLALVGGSTAQVPVGEGMPMGQGAVVLLSRDRYPDPPPTSSEPLRTSLSCGTIRAIPCRAHSARIDGALLSDHHRAERGGYKRRERARPPGMPSTSTSSIVSADSRRRGAIRRRPERPQQGRSFASIAPRRLPGWMRWWRGSFGGRGSGRRIRWRTGPSSG